MADLRDLRSTALDTKRLHDRKAKWAYGVRDETVLTWYGEPKPVTYRNRPSRVERQVEFSSPLTILLLANAIFFFPLRIDRDHSSVKSRPRRKQSIRNSVDLSRMT